MDSPSPAPWTFAARAGYFGERVCRFCEHHSPVDAKFCSDCGAPLHLKPCIQCDAVNHQTATNCYKCGAEYPTRFTIPATTPLAPAADPAADDAGDAASVRQPRVVASSGWRSLAPGQFLLAYVAMILIAGAYAAYRVGAATPDAIRVASPIGAPEHNAPAAAPVVAKVVESKPAEPDTTTALQAPIPAANPEAPKRANARHRPVPVRAPKRASAQQSPVPAPDPWQAMHVSLAQCGGDLIARIVCDQRVRRRFCEGHWGEAPECASGAAHDRGQ